MKAPAKGISNTQLLTPKTLEKYNNLFFLQKVLNIFLLIFYVLKNTDIFIETR
jgi:hypothetical protein